VEGDPVAQGYAAGTYDVVLATNVLHATSDMTRTLRACKALLRHGGLLGRWRNRRQWPATIEAILSLLWWHALALLVILAIAIQALEVLTDTALSPFPWGIVAVVIAMALLQITVGLAIDRRYDRTAVDGLLIMPWYPIAYWFIVGVVALVVTIPTILRPRRAANVRWKVDRSRE
jgi:hypothetical protein